MRGPGDDDAAPGPECAPADRPAAAHRCAPTGGPGASAAPPDSPTAPAGVGAAPPDAASARPADALVIAGLVPLSTVDWPGHLVATVFTQGCPWNCFYCHNHALIPTRVPGTVPWAAVRELLGRRHGLLDGVVLTGGEALRQDCLADAVREVVEAGFQVGLHTAGCYPRRLADLVASGLLSWVGLDVKALPEHYPAVVGRPNSGQKAWESLDVLLAAQGEGGPDFEVRTTVVPGDVTAADALEVARRCRDLGVGAYALQQARTQGAPEGFTAVAPGWDAQCGRLAAQIEALGFERFEYRPA